MHRAETTRGMGKMTKDCALGALIGIIALGIIMALATFAFEAEVISESLMPEVVIGCTFISATIGGIVSSKRHSRGLSAAGVLQGVLLFLPLMIIGSAVCEGAVLGNMTLKILIASIAGGSFGGALCMERGKKKRRRK